MRPLDTYAAALYILTVVLLSCGTPAVRAESDSPRTIGRVKRLDPALDELIAQDAAMQIIGDGFEWCEGPVWVPSGEFLLFSDVPKNSVMRWDEKSGVTQFLKPSGYTGEESRGGESGSNGLALDRDGKLLLCQHGDRRVARLQADLKTPKPNYATLAARYEGKRFNSPNDLVVHSSGAVYFTDPPYGLEKNMEDRTKELRFQGVYRIGTDGDVTLLTKNLERPNGVALSPDEKTLYVANSHGPRPVIMAFPVKEDGTIGEGRVFFDATELATKHQGACDGMTVDQHGNVFATTPGGVSIFSPDGKHLGLLATGKFTSNCTFGDDGSTLFITADDLLLRVDTKTKGIGY